MRIVRDYFGLDRTTVTYDCEITGVGGDADSFYIVADVIQSSGRSAARTVVTLSHDEMARMLADYRHNCAINTEGPMPARLHGPRPRAQSRYASFRRFVILLKSAMRTRIRKCD